MRLDRLGQQRALDDRVEGLLGREDGVEIGHVDGAAHGRLERRLDLLLREALPVYLLEERMAPDLVRAVDAQALRGVARQQAGQDRPRARGNFIWEEERIAQDLFVHLVGDFWETKKKKKKSRKKREGRYKRRVRSRASISQNARRGLENAPS